MSTTRGVAARHDGGPVVDQLVACLECGECAEVVWRTDLESTSGPMAHAYVRCVQRHWFLLPVEYLDGAELAEVWRFPSSA